MPTATLLYSHPLCWCPALEGQSPDRLMHREIPGRGAQECAGSVADSALLLISHRLLVEAPPPVGPERRDALFRDPPDLLDQLQALGMVARPGQGQAWEDNSGAVAEAVRQGLEEYGPWLTALKDGAREWTRVEALMSSLWAALCGEHAGWKEFLREVGLSGIKHDYRNQSQAINAISSLHQWGSARALESSMLKDALAAELTYIYASACAAAHHGAILHDWSDFLPLYRELSEPDAAPVLAVRLPGLKVSSDPAVAEILASPPVRAARDMTAAALSGEPVAPRDVEAELLRAVPANCRTPYLYRQVAFYRYAPDFTARMGLPRDSLYAISTWRASGLN